MAYQPAENLSNRTFVGLITAQFLAGFNDQAIHASAMFYAIRTDTLSEASAITLMPILFFAPWAIFCTLAGHFADRYSKTMTLRFWKASEIVISLIMIGGFYVGSYAGHPKVGGWIVLSCVFLIGTHAAFFGPAKYGAMPEILRPHILSRGNGILESTTFLANIFGTVSGGLLMYQFHRSELWIGVILLALSVIGAGASFLIAWLPAASPERIFPANPFKPLFDNLKKILRSRPLALAVLGIAFFVFMVAYMRASMYMHGETRNPRWNELKTSIIVAFVALGVGLGSPLAGYLSGDKIELGLVPIGCLGMTFGTLLSAVAIENDAILVVALIIIGFFSGFYMVPLYTLLQHRAPKDSKGELIATCNFINVTGAIIASLLFNVLVQASRFSGVAPEIPPPTQVAAGLLEDVPKLDMHGKIIKVAIKNADGRIDIFRAKGAKEETPDDGEQELTNLLSLVYDLEPAERVIEFNDDLFDVLSGAPTKGDEVIVNTYTLRGVQHFLIRKADQPLRKLYDNQILPRYLFIGASFMTVVILLLLWRTLPDFFVRSLFWYKSLGRYRLKALGMQHLPTEGPVILATNSADLPTCLQLISATDRTTKVIVVVEDGTTWEDGPLLRRMALHSSIVTVRPGETGASAWLAAKQEALRTLQGGHLLAVSVSNHEQAPAIRVFLRELRDETHAPLLPAYCGFLDPAGPGVTPRVRVVFGEPLPETPNADAPPTLDDCKKALGHLADWIRQNDDIAGTEPH